ncbi:hypothetical protein ACFSJ1_21040 [Trinickia caryophylli]|uniref:hypothetical protein n=1 Tax=Trinickia caryophylli TaxID=28094 RepID=UPI0036266E5E
MRGLLERPDKCFALFLQRLHMRALLDDRRPPLRATGAEFFARELGLVSAQRVRQRLARRERRCAGIRGPLLRGCRGVQRRSREIGRPSRLFERQCACRVGQRGTPLIGSLAARLRRRARLAQCLDTSRCVQGEDRLLVLQRRHLRLPCLVTRLGIVERRHAECLQQLRLRGVELGALGTQRRQIGYARHDRQFAAVGHNERLRTIEPQHALAFDAALADPDRRAQTILDARHGRVDLRAQQVCLPRERPQPLQLLRIDFERCCRTRCFDHRGMREPGGADRRIEPFDLHAIEL